MGRLVLIFAHFHHALSSGVCSRNHIFGDPVISGKRRIAFTVFASPFFVEKGGIDLGILQSVFSA